MRILGIDPGLATVGLGLIESTSPHDLRTIEWLTLTTKAGLPLGDRLEEIWKDLTGFLQETEPEFAVVERLFFATNQRTAIDVSHARGVILLTLTQAGIPFIEPTPLQLKSCITGDGQASKKQVQQMLGHMLRLTDGPTQDDAADALALAAYGALQGNRIVQCG